MIRSYSTGCANKHQTAAFNHAVHSNYYLLPIPTPFGIDMKDGANNRDHKQTTTNTDVRNTSRFW